jgi:hypothetical protein
MCLKPAIKISAGSNSESAANQNLNGDRSSCLLFSLSRVLSLYFFLSLSLFLMLALIATCLFIHIHMWWLLFIPIHYSLKEKGPNLIIFPFLTCLEGSTKLVCLLQNPNFSLDKDLVIISDIMSQVWIFSITKNFISIASRIY